MKYCEYCGVEFHPKKNTAKYCSLNCRVTASRKGANVTQNVTLSQPTVTQNFKFTVLYARKPGDKGYDQEAHDKHKTPRTAKYWYDVPLAAQPILEKGWPKMPDFMNGRQYFLWMKNEFKENDGTPEIHNPFPKYDKVEYVGGPMSRAWGDTF